MTEAGIVRRVGKEVNNDDIYEMVKEAVELIGGWKDVVKKGDKVLIKPNMVRPAPPPTTTDPRVIAAIVKLAYEHGAGEVWVGDDTATMTHWWREEATTRQVMDANGVTEAVEAVGGKIVPFDEDEWIEVEIPGALTQYKARLAKKVMDCNVYISAPIAKGSMEGTVTLNIKGLQGITDPYITRLEHHRQDLAMKLVDILRVVRPKMKLNIIDMIKPMEGRGPIYGKPVEGFNTIVATKDPVAGDVVGCLIMGYNHEDHDMSRLAGFYGLGESNPDNIKIKGTPLSEFTYKFESYFPHVKGVYENVDVIEGGTCNTCRAWIRFALDALKGKYPNLGEVIKRSVGKLTILSGIEPPLPEDVRDLQGKVIVFGDCAIMTAKKVKRVLETKATYVMGCPPFEIGPVVQAVKKAMNLEVTGKEAYEGYGVSNKLKK